MLLSISSLQFSIIDLFSLSGFLSPLLHLQGNKRSRETMREYEWYTETNHLKFHVCLTTYETVTADDVELGNIRWACVMVDEAHRLKNSESRCHLTLSRFTHHHRVLITGTPLQNSLRELWALLRFIMPEQFASWEMFSATYGELGDGDHNKLSLLHEHLKPYLIRRVKKEVEKSLPSKVEQILRVGLSHRQREFYKHIVTRNYSALRSLKGQKQTSLINVIMELKKCCNHASLVEGENAPRADDEASILRQLLKGSGKLMLLDKLLMRLKERGNRVLIFSQMVMMLDVLALYLQLRGYTFQRLDGNVTNERRKQAINHFNAPNSRDFCFLLSTRAGGLGVNLATADTVVIFDSDWNPQNDLQAQARAHRIGQKKQVNIYRLVTKSTVEEDILERAKQKMVLDHLVIQRMDTTGGALLNARAAQKKGAADFSKTELDAIIKFGAAELFKENPEGGDAEDRALEEMDIDTILSKAETHDTSAASGGLGGDLLSAFKTVDIATNEDELDGEDEKPPDWEDIIPEEERQRLLREEEEEKTNALLLGPRRRKKVRRVCRSRSIGGIVSVCFFEQRDVMNTVLLLKKADLFCTLSACKGMAKKMLTQNAHSHNHARRHCSRLLITGQVVR